MTRLERMLREYGEVITKTQAVKILRCGRKRLNQLISDGVIVMGCGGTKVDVRSVVAYMDMPATPQQKWHVVA